MEPEFIVVGPDVPSVAADVQGPITLESVSIQGGVTNVEIGRANSASGFVNLLHAYIFRLVDIVCNIELWAVGPVEDAVLFADSVACGRALAIEGGAIIERIVWTSPRVGADLGIFVSGMKGEVFRPLVLTIAVVSVKQNIIQQIKGTGDGIQAAVVNPLVGFSTACTDAHHDRFVSQTVFEEDGIERSETECVAVGQVIAAGDLGPRSNVMVVPPTEIQISVKMV
mmetsp:Transcript_31444/g.57579  ORF Transcript_31444/g.57579 Transcript_31444/m.57579 type:complete len:226 (+) Transcript_31444:1258-1935(+)